MTDHKRQPFANKLMQMAINMGGVADAHAIIEATDDDDSLLDTFDWEDNGHTVFSFIPDGEATFSEMEEAGESVSDERLAYTYSDGIPVPGRFTRLVVASGKVNLYKVKL